MVLRQIFSLSPLLLVTLLLAGCGNGNGNGEPANGNGPVEPPTDAGLTVPEPMQAFEDDGNVNEILIRGDDRMRFDRRSFSVEPGQMVRITLEHTGQLPAQSMGHNVVVLVQGDDPVEFGADVDEAGGNMENAYVPEDLRDRVLAYTAMIGGGETAVVEFRAPDEPGEYPFLCSFPGHAGQMNGMMEVE